MLQHAARDLNAMTMSMSPSLEKRKGGAGHGGGGGKGRKKGYVKPLLRVDYVYG